MAVFIEVITSVLALVLLFGALRRSLLDAHVPPQDPPTEGAEAPVVFEDLVIWR